MYAFIVFSEQFNLESFIRFANEKKLLIVNVDL